MEFILIIALILGGIFIFLRLLTNWLLSKILSEACSIVSLINSFFLVSTAGSDNATAIWIYIICTILGWVFFMAENIFDTEYEGLRLDSDGTFVPVYSGGFWGNLGGAAGFTLITLFIALAGEFYALFYIVPIFLLIINTISIFKG